ncbi:hypothetical protein P7C70_g9378, partial [Phenoliferia sp. Uapishka_3]
MMLNNCTRMLRSPVLVASTSRLVPTIAASPSRALHAPATVAPESRIPRPRGYREPRAALSEGNGRTNNLTEPATRRLSASSHHAGPYQTPLDVLSASKRKLETYAPKLGSWEEMFTKTSADLRDAGMTIKERRYTLWLLEKFRQGGDVKAVAIAAPPKKKVSELRQ